MQIRIITPAMELWRIENEFTNDPHVHNERVQVTMPIRGTCHFTQERRQYRLDAGCALVQHPCEEHHFRIGEQAGVIVIQLEASRIAEDVRTGELTMRRSIDARELQLRFREWTAGLLAGDPYDRMAQQETETLVADYMSRILSGNVPSADDPPEARTPRGRTDPHLARAVDYIRAHYRSPVSIDELAAVALLSRYHFIRTFKAATGLSPYQYVLRVRIEEAKRMLRTTRMSVTDISLHVGFSSPSQLHRAFVNMVGASPEQFRTLG